MLRLLLFLVQAQAKARDLLEDQSLSGSMLDFAEEFSARFQRRLADRSVNPVKDSIDNLVDQLAHGLVERAQQDAAPRAAGLENTTFGKPARLAAQPAVRSRLQTAPAPSGVRTRRQLPRDLARGAVAPASYLSNVSTMRDVRELEARRDKLLAELADINRGLEATASLNKEDASRIGSRKSIFEPSFGYLSKSAGVYTDVLSSVGSNLPSNALDLGIRNFQREWPELLKTLNGTRQVKTPDSAEAAAFRAKLDKLVLSNDAVWAREKLRPPVQAPLVLLIPYYVLCWCLDVLFEGRPISRFWFLETVARMPYFAYVSSLHLYETLGWWRRSAEVKRVHFAEEWNEFHHLLTMEALGGDQLWQDRFLAQHAAIVYFYVLVGMWFLSPSLAYKFSELIEAHAVDTYGEFVDANRELLGELPAPRISRLYWNGPDLFLFDEFQTSRARGSRRPTCETLLDVFSNIRDDEAEHVATMAACQDLDVALTAPKVEAALITTAVVGAAAAALLGGGDVGDLSDVVDSVAEVAGTVTDAAENFLKADGIDVTTEVLDVAGEAISAAASDVSASAEQGVQDLEALPGVATGLAAVAAVAQQVFSESINGAKVSIEEGLADLIERFLGGGGV